MSRITITFDKIKAEGKKALIPFMTAGDPGKGYTVPLMHAVVEAGADIIELGVPFSDPMADGPVIQRASERAGKTHLSAAIANYRAGLGDPPLFVMVPDLLDHLRAAFSPNAGTSYDRRFDEVRTAPLLVLDDLGSQSATPWAKEKLHQLLNYRYNAELPTVITVAKESLEQHQVDERIITRMLDERLCNYVMIDAHAFQGKAKKGRK